jgi:hypothetical protein
MHVSDEVLLAFLDQEAEATERSEIEEHLARCDECAALWTEVRSATRRVSEALETLDVQSPWAGMPEMPEELVAAARAEAPGDPGGDDSQGEIRSIETAPSVPSASAAGTVRRARRLSGRGMAIAASLVFLLAAGAWAIPGSPVRDWLSRSLVAVSSLFDAGEPEAPGAAVSDEPGPPVSGVSVEPLAGSVSISIRAPVPGTRVRVTLVPDGIASVAGTSGRYQVGPGRIEIQGPGGEMTIRLPETVPDARVEVDGRLVVRKQGDDLTLTPAADSTRSQILFELGG